MQGLSLRTPLLPLPKKECSLSFLPPMTSLPLTPCPPINYVNLSLMLSPFPLLRLFHQAYDPYQSRLWESMASWLITSGVELRPFLPGIFSKWVLINTEESNATDYNSQMSS
jgi:hypothetical protein